MTLPLSVYEFLAVLSRGINKAGIWGGASLGVQPGLQHAGEAVSYRQVAYNGQEEPAAACRRAALYRVTGHAEGPAGGHTGLQGPTTGAGVGPAAA